MKIIVFYVTAALCFTFSEQHGNDIAEISTDETLTTTKVPQKETIENAINKFGFKLLKESMLQRNSENIVISPTGIAGLLAMTLLGSTGETYDEIASLLGFSQDIRINRQHHEDFGARLQHLNSNETQTLYANAIFVDRHSKLRQPYRTYLKQVYNGAARHIDFNQSQDAKDIINEWVKEHTNSKIEQFLQQPLPESTKAALLTALYFSGQWSAPFVPEYTMQWAFKAPTKEVMVDLMANFGQFNYLFSYENGVQLIELPYKDNITSMYVIKPAKNRFNLTQLLDRIDYDEMERLVSQMTKKKCVIRFPKMNLQNRLDLKDTLKALGAQSMFKPGVANFAVMLESEVANNTEDTLIARINQEDGEARSLKQMLNNLPNPGVHVDSVIHEVKMNIDEYGTEAVAATSAVMARTAEMFYADSPFVMFIRNKDTKLITFAAAIYDPTA